MRLRTLIQHINLPLVETHCMRLRDLVQHSNQRLRKRWQC